MLHLFSSEASRTPKDSGEISPTPFQNDFILSCIIQTWYFLFLNKVCLFNPQGKPTRDIYKEILIMPIWCVFDDLWNVVHVNLYVASYILLGYPKPSSVRPVLCVTAELTCSKLMLNVTVSREWNGLNLSLQTCKSNCATNGTQDRCGPGPWLPDPITILAPAWKVHSRVCSRAQVAYLSWCNGRNQKQWGKPCCSSFQQRWMSTWPASYIRHRIIW